MFKVAKLLAGVVATGTIAWADDSPAQKSPEPIIRIQAQASQATPAVQEPVTAPTTVSSSSVASDDPMKWTGFYFGVNSGYTFGQAGLTNSAVPTANFGAFGAPELLQSMLLLGNGLFNLDKAGYIGGGQIGYNYRFADSPVLIGVEADFMGVGLQRTTSSTLNVPIQGFPLNSVQGDFSATQKLQNFGSVRARAGLLWGDKLLTYGTVGYAYGDSTLEVNGSQTINGPNGLQPQTSGDSTLEVNGSQTINGPNGLQPQTSVSSASSRKVLHGHVEGFGVEYAINKRWSVKAEILHYDLGSQSVDTSYNFAVGPGALQGTPFSGVNVNSKVNVAGFINLFGVNYHY